MPNAAIRSGISTQSIHTILLAGQDVVVRAPLAQYLRSCGYRVLEARDAKEALTILQESSEEIPIVLSGPEDGFRLSGWIRANRPHVKVIIAATLEHAARAAADLCEVGPHLKRPYDPQLLIQEIRAHLGRGAGD